MPFLTKRLIQIGARFSTAHTARKLRRTGTSVPSQQREWKVLVSAMATTTCGRSAGLERGMKYAAFRERVPLQNYEAIAPFIERMKRGESGVLWPGQCSFYALSSGTASARTKFLPINSEMIRHFRRASARALLFYTARVGHTRVFEGRHLFLGGSSALAPLPESKPFAAYGGDISGIVAMNLPVWAQEHFYEPGLEIARMGDWPARIDATIERTWNRDISLVGGLPNWILAFAEQLRARVDAGQSRLASLQGLWPKLECLVHGGIPIGPFADELRAILGPGVNFHEVYPSSEGFIAAQDADARAGLRLFADLGIFFEFLPMADFDEAKLAQLGTKAVPLEGVKAGVDYALLLTTPAGLCRYAPGDVVRFISTEPPRLIGVGHTKLRLNAFGEDISEKDLTDLLLQVCQHNGWHIVNFHVAPLSTSTVTGHLRGRHEWWVELKSGTAATPTGPILGAELDTELQKAKPEYAKRRRSGALEMPVVRLVIPGVFGHWMSRKGKWGGQYKMPRCRSDRDVADELSNLTRFTETQTPWSTLHPFRKK